eukprot:TRINITY_DN2400_c3_g1_i1.p1 TRINITY_DN2400_c3_g1~~TRINITY_DN2400_c3_g1_i1.p1  ORF type:complete len:1044 (+),score=270.42 TRINITY_DN2400_c3_g1_i1:282-3134(+)
MKWDGKNPTEHLKEYCTKHKIKISYERQRRREGDVTTDVRMLVALITEVKNAPPSRAEHTTGDTFKSEASAREMVATIALYSLLHKKNIPLYKSLPPEYRAVWLGWAEEKEKHVKEVKDEVDRRKTTFISRILESDKKLHKIAPKPAKVETKKDVVVDDVVDCSTESEEEVYDDWMEEADGKMSSEDAAIRDEWDAKVTQERSDYWRCLPVHDIKQHFLNTIKKTSCAIVSGETGCGKTTQIPRFILEDAVHTAGASSVNIVCCQPRRISAISVARRVADELSQESSGLVGYHTRGAKTVTPATRLTFCTTGILLRYLHGDPTLSNITHVIIDEVHERSLHTDFLLQILRELLFSRKDLKVILMSATIEVSTYASYFNGCPVMTAPGRTHPVSVFWLEDILMKTGYRANEFRHYTTREDDRCTKRTVVVRDVAHQMGMNKDAQDTLEMIDETVLNVHLLTVCLEHIEEVHGHEGSILVFLPGIQEINSVYNHLMAHERFCNTSQYMFLRLHSLVDIKDQNTVFNVLPRGVRKIVLATNIAETSITIPDVVFVIDCGRVKEVRYEALSKMRCLVNTAVSKANAKQRWGRAGRVKEGYCFNLYSRHTFDEMRDFQLPEMLRSPLEDVCLDILSLGVGGTVEDFLKRSVSPPDADQVEAAMALLTEMGAAKDDTLTSLGRHLSNIPLEVGLGKALVYGSLLQCSSVIMNIVATLSVKSPFLLDHGDKQLDFADAHSDHLAYDRVYRQWTQARSENRERRFCQRAFISDHTMWSVKDVVSELKRYLSNEGLLTATRNNDKYAGKVNMIGAVMCAGMYPCVLKGEKVTKEGACRWYSREGEVVIGKSSANYEPSGSRYLVYSEKVRASKARVFVKDTTSVHYMVVVLLGGKLVLSHVDQSMLCGGWIRFTGWPRTLALLVAFRNILQNHVDAILESGKATSDDRLMSLLYKLISV